MDEAACVFVAETAAAGAGVGRNSSGHERRRRCLPPPPPGRIPPWSRSNYFRVSFPGPARIAPCRLLVPATFLFPLPREVPPARTPHGGASPPASRTTRAEVRVSPPLQSRLPPRGWARGAPTALERALLAEPTQSRVRTRGGGWGAHLAFPLLPTAPARHGTSHGCSLPERDEGAPPVGAHVPVPDDGHVGEGPERLEDGE